MRKAFAALLVLGAACSSTPTLTSQRVVAAPAPTASPDPTPAPTPPPPTPSPTRPPTPPPPATPAPTPAPVVSAAFRGLGSWIDVFDHTDDPATVVPLVRAMAERGVKTLYLETARFASATDIQYPVALGAALDEAKAKGMHVVAWYPPAFDDLERDVRRSLAAIAFVSPKGNRFDAFGADIEYTQAVPDDADRSRRAVQYSRRVRAAAGPSYPLAGIVIPPSWLELRPDRWPGFPWAELSEVYELFMPMNYWTARGKDPQTAEDLTKRDAAETKRLTGRPVHMIGGLGEHADEAQVTAYVNAARESGSVGGGLYDFETTRAEVWDELVRLN